jgi:hypothetical protein
MHSFGLLIVSILSHPFAKAVVVKAQRIVSYFLASTLPLRRLRDCLKEKNIAGGGLVSSNKTRFNSVAECLKSVLRAQPALHELSMASPPVVKNAEVLRIIKEDSSFWAAVQLLCDILEPASKAVMAIQARTALLASIPIYWAVMARALEKVLEPLLSHPSALLFVFVELLCCILGMPCASGNDW